jgi:hypothetical protein
MKRICHAIVILMCALTVCTAQRASLSLPVGGLAADKVLKVTGAVTLREPDGSRGRYKHGFRVLNDSAVEWQKFYGVQFGVNLPDARQVELTATIIRAERSAGVAETPASGTVRVTGQGWHTITMPWSAFDFEQANFGFLKYVKVFTVSGKLDGQPLNFQLRNVRGIVHVPFGEGSLAGKFTAHAKFAEGDFRNNYFAGDRLDWTVNRVETMRKALITQEPDMAAVALKFCLKPLAVPTVIPGMRNARQAEMNCGVSDLPPLSDALELALRQFAWRRGVWYGGKA